MKVQIDREECIACGSCWDDCLEVFEEDETDGTSQILEEYRVNGDPAVGEIPDQLERCVRTAAEGCPVEIIHVEG